MKAINGLYDTQGQLLGQEQYSASGKKVLAHYWIWLDDLPLAGYRDDGFFKHANLSVQLSNQFD